MAHFICPFCNNIQIVPEAERESEQICKGCQRVLRVKNRPKPPAADNGARSGTSKPARKRSPAAKFAAKPPAAGPAPAPVQSSLPAADFDDASHGEAGVPEFADDVEPGEEPGADVADSPSKKRKKGAIGNLLGSLGALLVLAAIVLLLTGWWRPVLWVPLSRLIEQFGIPAPIALILALLILILPIAIIVLRWIKSSMLAGVPVKVEFVPTQASQHPKLNKKGLQEYTEDFEALGFRQLLDYQVKSNLQSTSTGFGRLMVHDQHRCFAEINQVVRPEGPGAPMRCMTMSFLENDWSLMTGDREPNGYSYIMRRPRALWVLRPEAMPGDLVKEHLNRRAQMVKDLEVGVLPDTTAEAYFAHEQEAAIERRKALQRKNIVVALLELQLFKNNPKTDWLGKYAGKAA